MTKEGSTKIVTFMNPLGSGFCARAWPYKSYSENAFFPDPLTCRSYSEDEDL